MLEHPADFEQGEGDGCRVGFLHAPVLAYADCLMLMILCWLKLIVEGNSGSTTTCNSSQPRCIIVMPCKNVLQEAQSKSRICVSSNLTASGCTNRKNTAQHCHGVSDTAAVRTPSNGAGTAPKPVP